MDDTRIFERLGCCVPKKLDEETKAMLSKKYGPVMEPVPPKRYKFKRTLKCSPAEMKRIEEVKRQLLAQEAATGIKRPHPPNIAYPSPTTNVDPNCDGPLPVDLSQPLVSADVPPSSWQRCLSTYQQRIAAAVAALEAEAAARPPRPRLFIDSQMNVLRIYRQDEAALPPPAATGTKVQAECAGAGFKRPCHDDSNPGTSDSSETHAGLAALSLTNYSSLEVPSPKLVHEDPNPTTATVTEGQAECGGSGVKRPRDDLNSVAADYSSPTDLLQGSYLKSYKERKAAGVRIEARVAEAGLAAATAAAIEARSAAKAALHQWIDPVTKMMCYRESAAATVTQGQSEREGSVLKRPRSDTNPGATDPGFQFKVMNFLVAIPSP